MYIAGSESYTEVLLGSKDFYDMLMKIELVKRVADHDKNELDSLVKLKDEYEAELTALEQKQQELKEKNDELTAQKEKSEKQKKKLAGLYEKSKKLISELEKSEKAYKKNLKRKQRLPPLPKKHAWSRSVLNVNALNVSRLSSRQKMITAMTLLMMRLTKTKLLPTMMITAMTAAMPLRHRIQGLYGLFRASTAYPRAWAGAGGRSIRVSTSGTVIQYCNDCTHDYAKDGSCGCGGGYGNYVVIDHGNGYWTLYGHMQYTTVSLGDTVSQGQKIGVVGTTGWSTGDHCHFEVRQNGEPVDPTQYVSY